MMIPATSPFKLLKPYGQEDSNRYFGRIEETRRLTEILIQSKFVLLYGESGTGKTSLIQCGLRGMFSSRDWMPIFVRRGNIGFLEAIRQALTEQYEDYYRIVYPGNALPRIQHLSLRELIKALFNVAYVPVYLILDQFEEIFTLGSKEEQDEFFQALEDLKLFEEDLFCKCMIVVREEYIAHFYRFEGQLPFLFEHRFRMEKMRAEQLETVVDRTLQAKYEGYPEFRVQHGAPQQIVNNIKDDKRGEFELTTLQVYLDQLYREDVHRIKDKSPERQFIHFDLDLINNNKTGDALGDFLNRQLTQIEGPLPKGQDSKALQILFKFVTSEGLKKNQSATEIFQELEKDNTPVSQDLLQRYLLSFAGAECRILGRIPYTKDGEERFEIAHDQLAKVVFSKFTDEERRRRDARLAIQIGLKKFHDATADNRKQRPYLDDDDIALVKKLINIEKLDPTEQIFFRESLSFRNRQRKRERMVTIGAILAAVVFLGVAVFAFQQTLETKWQKCWAESNENGAVLLGIEAQNNAHIADLNAREAEKNARIAQGALDNLRKEQIQKNISKAEFYFQKKSYDDAIKAYKDAADLYIEQYEKYRINRLINKVVDEKNKAEFERNLNIGMSMKAAHNCKSALLYFQKAKAINAGHSSLNKAIEECQ